MDNLKHIIGPAPSEMTEAEVATLLTSERNRVRDAIERFKARPTTQSVRAKRNETKKLVLDSGFSVDQLLQLIQEEKDARLAASSK